MAPVGLPVHDVFRVTGRTTPAPPARTDTTSARGDPAASDLEGAHVTQQPAGETAGFGPDLAEVFGPSQQDGGPELVQLLTPEGERVEHPDFSFDLGDDVVRGFYRDMVLTRRIDTEATALQRHGELGIWAQLLGQEAAQIGAGRALRPQDFVFPTYREHGVAWCRGVDPLDLLGLFRGVDQGSWDPAENNFGLYTIVIGAQTLHATGYAMGMQRDGVVGTGDPDRDAAVIAHFGDGASSQGDVNEAFIFAASYNAPVVFFCQNNQWAISEPIQRQTRIPLYQRALGFGFPGVRVDGNDVLATYAVTQAALQRAREGQGPTLVEAYTYRMGAHTTTDDPTRYRLSDDVEHWKLKDPIARVKVYLSRNGLADDDFFAAVEQEAAELGHYLREGCKALPDPKPLSMFDHVYAEETPELAAQREGYAAYLETFEASTISGGHS
jgi:pyruvate dehydrogenase E1 component alpha subunit